MSTYDVAKKIALDVGALLDEYDWYGIPKWPKAITVEAVTNAGNKEECYAIGIYADNEARKKHEKGQYLNAPRVVSIHKHIREAVWDAGFGTRIEPLYFVYTNPKPQDTVWVPKDSE
jgi:hypothetical protein